MGRGAYQNLKALLTAFLAGVLFASPVVGEVYRIEDLGGGIHDTVPGNLIADNEAVDITNFHVDPFSRGLIQREGSRKQNSTQLTGKKTVDVFTYVQQDGDEFVLAFSSKSIYYSSDNAATFTTLITTSIDGVVWDCATFIDDKAYCVTQTTSAFNFNGSAHTVTTQTPAGKYIEAYQNRLWVANTAANPGRLFFSDLLLGSTWTTSTNFIDFPEAITGVGEPYDDGLPIYTVNNTWMIRGDDPTNFRTQQISGRIGCIDDRTIKNFKIGNNEYQIFLSKGINQTENNFYALDGVTVRPIGSKYLNALAGVNTGNANTRRSEWDTQSDFSAGTLGTGLTITESPGDVKFSTGTLVDSFTDSDYTASPAWTAYGVSNATITVTSGVLGFGQSNDSSPGSAGLHTAWTFSSAIGIQFKPTSFTEPGFSPTALSLAVSFNSSVPTGISSNHGVPTGANSYSVTFTRDGNPTSVLRLYRNTTEISSHTYSATGSLPTSVEIFRSTSGYITAYADGSVVLSTTSLVITSFTHLSVAGYIGQDVGQTNSVSVDDFYVKYATGVYQSQSVAVGSGTASWGTFDITETLGNGFTSYNLYSDSDTSTNINNPVTFISSQVVTNSGIPTIAFSNYFVWASSYSRIVSTQTPTTNSAAVNWNLSAGGHRPDAEVYNGNYWMAYTGGSESRNQSMLVINRENAAYTMEYGTTSQHGFYGLTVSQGRLFGGDSNTDASNGGYVWWLETGNTDDGQPITATATLKHQEFAGMQMDDHEKSLQAAYVNYEVGTGTFTATILQNFTENSNTYTIPFASGTTVNRYKIEPRQQTTGRQLGLRFVNSYPSQRLKLYPPITYHFGKVRLIKQQ